MGHDHSHGVSGDSDSRMIGAALVLILAFMGAEIAAGIIADSLALLSDAAHMLTDAGALALALFAIRLARRPAAGDYTFGLKRAEILSAQLNGLTLLVLGALIVFEGIRRLFDPPEVEGLLVVVVGVLGAGVNLAAAGLMRRADRRSLNVEGAFQHIVTDLFASLGAALAGAVILTTGFERADGIASLLVAALMFRSAYALLRDSGRVFMEAAPKGLDPERVGNEMASESGVVEIHDLHVWEVTSGMPSISAHVLVEPGIDCQQTRWRLARMLEERFGVEHSTLQVENELRDELLEIEPAEQAEPG